MRSSPTRRTGSTRSPGKLFYNTIDHALAKIVEGAKRTAYLTSSSGHKPALHFLRVYGTKNTAHADFNNRTVALDRAQTVPSALGRVLPAFEHAVAYAGAGVKNLGRFCRSRFHFFAGLGELISRFYDSVREGAPLPIPHRDMRQVAWMMDGIFAELRRGRLQEAS